MSPVVSNKKVKKLARERQRQTGERYTVALAYVRQEKLTMNVGYQLEKKDAEQMVDLVDKEASSNYGGFPIFPLPFWLSDVVTGVDGSRGNAILWLEPGKVYTLLSAPMDWAVELGVIGLSARLLKSSTGLEGLFVGGFRVVREGEELDGSGKNLLVAKAGATEAFWQDARHYGSLNYPWNPLSDESVVLGPKDRMRLSIRYMGPEPIVVVISTTVNVRKSIGVFRGDAPNSFVPEKFTDPLMCPLEASGTIYENPMEGSEEKGLFSVLGASGYQSRFPEGMPGLDQLTGGEHGLGNWKIMTWKVDHTCVLHGVLVCKNSDLAKEDGTLTEDDFDAVILRDLVVCRNNLARTPSLLKFSKHDTGGYHSRISASSHLRGNPILVPGDVVSMAIAALAPSGKCLTGSISVLTHLNYGQKDLSRLLEHLDKDTGD